jgi:hypothetical protein
MYTYRFSPDIHPPVCLLQAPLGTQALFRVLLKTIRMVAR